MSNNREISLILPSTGDPLILHYWLENLKTYRHLVTNVFISIDCMGKLDPMEYLFIENSVRRLLSRHPGIRENINFLLHQHGNNITNLLEKFGPDIKDTILLMEEDDYVLNPELLKEAIDEYFDKGLDVCGYGRGSCSVFIEEKTAQLLQDRTDLIVDRPSFMETKSNFNFWPTLFLIKKDLMMNSSKDFCAKTWNVGETIKFWEREYVLEEQIAGDTMVAFCLELLNNPKVKKIKYLGNTYHSRLEDSEIIPTILSTSINFHVGSMSTILANRFWKPKSAHVFDGYVLLLRNLDKNHPVYHFMFIEYYRRLVLLQQMLYSLKNPKEFEFFANYESNITNTLEIIESEHDIDAMLPKFGIQSFLGGFDVSVYAKLFKKMI